MMSLIFVCSIFLLSVIFRIWVLSWRLLVVKSISPCWSGVSDKKDHPVAIRVPVNGVITRGIEPAKDYGELNRYEISHLGEKVAVLGLGSYYQLGEEVVRLLEQEKGIDATLINPRFITGLDEALLDDLKKRHTLVVTLEDGVLDGGFGEKIARYYGPSEMKVLNYGVRKEFIDRFDVSEQLLKNRLTAPQIVEDICACTSFAG